LEDGEQRLDLYIMGPNSHVRDMVIMSVPKERLLFQADLFVLPAHGKGVPRATLSDYELATWLDQSGLAVERIADVHGRLGSIDEFRMAIATNPNNHVP
jgi:hypothetical protein